MIEAGRSRRLLLALLVASAFGGCGRDFEDEKPPAPPTTAELSRFVAETREPAYWLGPRFRGLAVSHVSAVRGHVGLTYGPWSCDSGCTEDGGVWTGPRDIGALSEADGYTGVVSRKCWSRVGKAVAVLLGCDPGGYPQELVIYTGTREILVTSLLTRTDEIPARAVVRRLRPLNAEAPWPLLRPTPLSCRGFERVDPRYRRHMPQALQPRTAC